MARKVCTAGVIGSVSFIVLDHDGSAVSSIRNDSSEIVTQHLDIDQATEWTERKVMEIVGKRYEAD